jgi:hypothetical protein
MTGDGTGSSRRGIAPCFIVEDVVRTAHCMSGQVGGSGGMRRNRLADPECEAWDAYGCRDFDVEDGNGDRLCFGQDIETR